MQTALVYQYTYINLDTHYHRFKIQSNTNKSGSEPSEKNPCPNSIWLLVPNPGWIETVENGFFLRIFIYEVRSFFQWLTFLYDKNTSQYVPITTLMINKIANIFFLYFQSRFLAGSQSHVDPTARVFCVCHWTRFLCPLTYLIIIAETIEGAASASEELISMPVRPGVFQDYMLKKKLKNVKIAKGNLKNQKGVIRIR